VEIKAADRLLELTQLASNCMHSGL